MHAGEGLSSIERGDAGSNTVLRKRGLSRIRNRLLREGMWEGLESRLILECNVRALIRLNKDNDSAVLVRHGSAIWCALFDGITWSKNDEMRIHEAWGVTLPGVQRCQVVAFAGHIETEM